MQQTARADNSLQAMPGFDIRPYLPHAIAATLGVFGLPAAFVLGMIMLPTPDPSVIVTSAMSVGLSTIASVVGNSIWMRNPASTNVSFGDLMIWGWMRRRRAEGQLNRGTRMLGLDRRGQPTREQLEITRDKQLKVLHELNEALEAKDPYTRGHSERVERHVYRTAAAMGLSVHDLQELRMAAALHDIGKIRVPDRIIRKPGKLTDEERSIMEEHSAVGSWMLSHVASVDVIAAVRHHHERWDGKGYPDGLENTDIPLYARIIAVCDTFDAITSTRPYRAKSERERAIEVLKAESGTQFDPVAVDVFLTSLPSRVPVAAMLLMLPGAGRVLREFARTVKRAGASSLASATAAASASVIIGAATVAPAIDRIPVRLPDPVAVKAVPAPGQVSVDSDLAVAAGPATPARIVRQNASSKSRVASVDADLKRETFDVAGAATSGIDEPVLGEPLDGGGDITETLTQDEAVSGSENGKSDEDHGKSGEAPGRSEDKPGKGNDEDKPGKGNDEDKPGKGNDEDTTDPDDGTGNPGNGNPGNGNPDPGNGNPGNGDPGTGNPGNGNPDPGNGNGSPGNGNPDPGTGNGGGNGNSGGSNSGGNPNSNSGGNSGKAEDPAATEG